MPMNNERMRTTIILDFFGSLVMAVTSTYLISPELRFTFGCKNLDSKNS